MGAKPCKSSARQSPGGGDGATPTLNVGDHLKYGAVSGGIRRNPADDGLADGQAQVMAAERSAGAALRMDPSTLQYGHLTFILRLLPTAVCALSGRSYATSTGAGDDQVR